jgi:hypothetical protein
MPSVPSYEDVLRHFRSRRGLFVLGAGASTGLTEFGDRLFTTPAKVYLAGGSFPVEKPVHPLLSQRIIRAARPHLVDLAAPDRIIRSGSSREVALYQQLLERLPPLFAELLVKHLLSKARLARRRSHNYEVFQFFRPTVLLNYNLDGLAADICGGIVTSPP